MMDEELHSFSWKKITAALGRRYNRSGVVLEDVDMFR